MASEKIEKLRNELNTLIQEQADFTEIQKISQLLDDCLVEYYNEKILEE